jgi:hypothetical protein
MDLADLETKGDLEELGEEPVEERERRPDLVLPEEGGGEARFGDDVSQLAQSHIDVDAGGVKNPAPLPASAMRLDEECLASKAPGRGKILLCLLTPTLQALELTGQVVGEVSSETRIADERIDVLAHEQGRRHNRLLLGQ